MSRRLWLIVLIGPLAWLAYLQTVSLLVPWACPRPTGAMVALLAAGMLALALSTAGVVQAWQRVGAGGAASRTRFIALTGIAASAVLVLVIVAGMLPVILLAPCG
jgi:hypothetical protein